MKKDNNYKVILVGEQGVGKSCLLQRYVKNVFDKEYIVTVGMDFAKKEVQIGDSLVTAQFWDTAGQEAFRSIVRSFYRNSAAIIIVYNVTKQYCRYNKFDGTLSILWICGLMISEAMQHRKLLLYQWETKWIRNSTDKQAVMKADLFFETSAMNGTNVQDVFYQTLEHIHQKDQPPAISEDTNGFRASVLSQQSIKQGKPKKESCC